MIAGGALIEAHNLERSVAVYPRIIISDRAAPLLTLPPRLRQRARVHGWWREPGLRHQSRLRPDGSHCLHRYELGSVAHAERAGGRLERSAERRELHG